MIRHIGSAAYRYCMYCKAYGIHNRRVYCPMTAPTDAPDGKVHDDFQTLDASALPMRYNSD
jgi:hypothetical protein